MFRKTIVALVALTTVSHGAQAASAAAKYLAEQHIASACEGRGGRMVSGGLQEVDITGDGIKDLILDHQGIECRGEVGRSIECGAANCSIYFYVRENKLLKLKTEILGIGATVLGGNPPRIEIGGTAAVGSSVIRWNGRKFK